MKLTGDKKDADGKPLMEDLELWWHDPVEVIKDLMGNPVFCEVMKYAPEKLFEDCEEKSHVINEIWTADWWWELQVSVLCNKIYGNGTDQNIRKSCHLVQQLYRSSSLQTKPDSHNSKETRAPGLYT